MKILSLGLTGLFVIILVVVGLNVSSIVPSPERYAAATATILRVQNLATQDAAYVQAYQTAVPTRIAEEFAAQRASDQAANDWLMGGLAMFVLVGLAVVVFIRSRAAIIPRGRDGQLPGVRHGNAVTDLQRAIGPTVVVQQPSAADRFWHLVKHQPLPAPHVLLTDGGADADHYLAAAESANQATTVAALMRPDQSDAERKQRLEIVTKNGGGLPLLGGGSSITRVVGVGDSAVDSFARAIAHEMGDHIVPAASPAVDVLPGNDAATPRLEPTAADRMPLSDDAPVSDEEWAASKPQGMK